MPTKREFIQALAKHLPPSSSALQLLDVGGTCGEYLQELRPDVQVGVASLAISNWQYAENSADAITGYDIHITDEFLKQALKILREGGRLIVLNPHAGFETHYAQQLTTHGYVRLLVENAITHHGVLIRGERTHSQQDTLARIQTIATHDVNTLTLEQYHGRFVHLLIKQSPNKPVWKLTPDENITWQAVQMGEFVLAFTSLPKAVGFMQSAVLENLIKDVNKMPKFKKELAQTWQFPILLNPILDPIKQLQLAWYPIDMHTAEASDE
jgi:hypothetical protein